MIERADSLNNQAILFAADGEFTEAIACFKRAITLDKENYLLWFNLGVTYRDAGELLLAQNALRQAYNIAPTNAEVIETYATISLALKDFPEVRFACEDGLDLNPLNAHLWNLLGVTCFQSEEYTEAAEFFEQAVYIDPFYKDGLYNLKDTYEVLHNNAGRIQCENQLKELEK